MEEHKELTPEQQVHSESVEASSLLDRGFEFTVGKRKFIIKQPPLGTLDMLSELYLKMDFDVDEINEDLMKSGKQLVKKHAKAVAKAVAISILVKKWKVRLYGRSLANYIYWNVTPSKLVEIVRLMNLTCNMKDFIISTMSMSASRTTKPTAVEQSKEA